MSILDNPHANINNDAKIAADQLKLTAYNTFQVMTRAFNGGAKIFWNNPSATPTQIANELGTDAKEIFELHYALGQLISSIKPETINETLNIIGSFTMNDDGTVTILE